MTSKKSTLWMGNIENWMNQAYLYNLLKSVNIFPSHIILKNYPNKRGCAFLEFYSKEAAQNVLNKYNNKTINVGNIDKSIPFEDVKKFFCSKYKSIISAKLIVNHENGNSKGYAFFEFTNYKEFSDALKLKGIIFGKQTLVLNSAKNKYENNDEDKINELSNMHFNNSDDLKSLDSSMISNQTIPLSMAETGLSSNRNSKELFNISNNYNYYNYNYNKITSYSFFDEKTNDNIKKNEIYKEIEYQIKDSLKKLSEQYYQYDNKPSLFNYYCSPFIYNSKNKKNYFFVNKFEENASVNSNDNSCLSCPFESCKDK